MVGICFCKTTGDVTDANDEYLRIVGKTREDLEAGRVNWIELTPPEYR